MSIKYLRCNILFFITRLNSAKLKRGTGDTRDCKGTLRTFHGVIHDVETVKTVLGVLGKCSESYGDL